MAVSFEEMLVRKRQRLPLRISRAEETFQIVRAKQDWGNYAFNVYLVSQSALCLGMLQARVDQDFSTVLKTFSARKVFAQELIQLVEDGDKFPQQTLADIEKNREVVANFELSIYCSLLSGDIDLAIRLAQAQKTFKLTQEPGWFELKARLLGALVLDDKVLFDSLLQSYNKLKLLYGQEPLDVYIKLYASVINRDKAQYEFILKKASEDFELRAKDKKLDEMLPEYGGGLENPFVLDFMALGVAVLANQRGMETNIDKEFFPQKLFKLILEKINGIS